MLSFSTRFSRSVHFASAFRSDPRSRTARSRSGPNLCRRSAILLLGFRTYSRASTALIRTTATASTTRFRFSRFRFVETSPHQECPENQIGSGNSLCHKNPVPLDFVPSSFHGLYCFAHYTGQMNHRGRSDVYVPLANLGCALTHDHNRADSRLLRAHDDVAGGKQECCGLDEFSSFLLQGG